MLSTLRSRIYNHKLNLTHFQVINDPAFHFQDHSHKLFIERFFYSDTFVFQPGTGGLILWRSFVLLLTLLSLFLIPLQLAFTFALAQDSIVRYLLTAGGGVFFIEACVQLNTGFYAGGDVVK